jgi:hypothetical protein
MRALPGPSLIVAALFAAGGCVSVPPPTSLTDSSSATKGDDSSSAQSQVQAESQRSPTLQPCVAQLPAKNGSTPPPSAQATSYTSGAAGPSGSEFTAGSAGSAATHVLPSVSTGAGAGQSGSIALPSATLPLPAPGTASRHAATAEHRKVREPVAGKKSPAHSSSSHKVPAPQPAHAGNGAMAHEMPARSGDDIVASRLRRAAEQESDPVMRAKLWQEYANYRKNTQAQ